MGLPSVTISNCRVLANSRFWCAKTEAVDSFTQNWSTERNWLCPPVSLITATICQPLCHYDICQFARLKVLLSYFIGPWPFFGL